MIVLNMYPDGLLVLLTYVPGFQLRLVSVNITYNTKYLFSKVFLLLLKRRSNNLAKFHRGRRKAGIDAETPCAVRDGGQVPGERRDLYSWLVDAAVRGKYSHE